ncbi:MAG: hypothetical protein HY303_02610, partial [Candidatus Wallbacteria bacterium]|nr:hypothetical protein [Candidatus Wallbacteria bacterium]
RFVLPGRAEVLTAEPRYPIVSLLALGGEAEGVATEGLRWNLAAEPLSPWRARGLSNRLLAARAVVSLRAGTLAIVEGGDWRPSDAPPVREV